MANNATLDLILERLDALHRRIDAAQPAHTAHMERIDALCARFDAAAPAGYAGDPSAKREGRPPRYEPGDTTGSAPVVH